MPRQLAEPVMDRASMTEMHGQHSPAAARAHEIAKGADDFAKLDLARLPPASGLRHQRRDPRPFVICQIRGVALGLLGDPGHPARLIACQALRPSSFTLRKSVLSCGQYPVKADIKVD